DDPASAGRPGGAPVEQRLPAALVHIWLREPETWKALLDTLAADLPSGVTVVRPGLLAVVPSNGAAEIFDIAARTARRLLRAAGGRARTLVVRGERRVAADGSADWLDPLAAELAQ